MGLFKKTPKPEPGDGSGGDPRNKVGQNPTGNPTRSSAKKRRQAAGKLERDLKGTKYEGK